MTQATADVFTYGAEKIQLIHAYPNGPDLRIGRFCSIGDGIKIFLGGNHPHDCISTYPFGHVFEDILGKFESKNSIHGTNNGNVIIGNDVWLANGATIMSGIRIGDGAIIAANSHIVKDVQPYEIVGGNPGKHIQFRFSDDIIRLLLKLQWWTLHLEDIKELMPILGSKPTVESLSNLVVKYRGTIP